MKELFAWARNNKLMAGGVVLAAAVLLWLLMRGSSSSAAASTSATDTSGTAATDPSLQALEIQAATTQQNAQLAASAQVAQYSAQVRSAAIAADTTNQQTNASLALALAQAYAGVETSNEQTQASLTLGLSQAGDATSSIIQLLGAQPGASAIAQQLLVSGIGPATPATPATTIQTHSGGAADTPPTTGTAGNTSLTQTGDSGGNNTTAAGSGTGVLSSVPAYAVQPGSSVYAPPTTLPQSASQPGQVTDLYETGVEGDIAGGGNFTPNPQYYVTPQTQSDFAGILGLSQSSVVPGGVGTAGGPFSQPAAAGVQVSQGAGTASGAGVVDTGQIVSGLQHTAPETWATQLAGYGISLTPAEENQIYQLFGSNQAVPEMSNETTNIGG